MRALLIASMLCGCVVEAPAPVGAPPDAPPAGDPPPPAEDEPGEAFTYRAPRLDLIVLMQFPHPELLWEAEVLVEQLEQRQVDYHLGVVDIDYVQADPSGFGLLQEVDGRRWADATVPDPASWLREAVARMTDSSSDECATYAAATALAHCAPGGPNAGFLREDSELALVIIDYNADVSPVFGFTEQEFIDTLRSLRPDPPLLGFHTILDRWLMPRDGAHQFEQAMAALEGVRWDMGDSFAPAFTAIAETVDPTNVFYLSGSPDPQTLRVVVHAPDGDEQTLTAKDFTYDPSTKRLDLRAVVPQDGASVDVYYTPAE